MLDKEKIAEMPSKQLTKYLKDNINELSDEEYEHLYTIRQNKWNRERGKRIDKIDYEILKNLVKEQNNKERCCYILNIDTKTLDKHLRVDFEMTWSEWHGRYKADGISKIQNAGYRKAMDGDTIMIKYFLDNEGGYSTKITTEQKISIRDISDEDLAKLDREIDDELEED